MSYARRTEVASDVYKSFCDSIIESPKYNGWSVAAGEYLLRAVRNFKSVKNSIAQNSIDHVAELEKYPADFFDFKSKNHRSKKRDLQRLARCRIKTINSQKIKHYLIFENTRFRVSSIYIACRYLNSIIPDESWDTWHSSAYVRRELERHGRCVLEYGDNKAIIEREVTA